jgi:hypothetical protein
MVEVVVVVSSSSPSSPRNTHASIPRRASTPAISGKYEMSEIDLDDLIEEGVAWGFLRDAPGTSSPGPRRVWSRHCPRSTRATTRECPKKPGPSWSSAHSGR